MALIVEDGTGLANADSYAAATAISDYAVDHGGTFPTDGSGDAAARRATQWLDATYRDRYPGLRRNQRRQALAWPRVSVIDSEGYAVDYASVPTEIVQATCEAAIREFVSPNSLSPDVVPGQVRKSVSVSGAVSVEYAVGQLGSASSLQPVITAIDGILAPLIGWNSNQYSVAAVRG